MHFSVALSLLKPIQKPFYEDFHLSIHFHLDAQLTTIFYLLHLKNMDC